VNITSDSPIITKSKFDRAGLADIYFNKDVLVPSFFFNLTSENEGPKYFNVTLIVNEANLLEFESGISRGKNSHFNICRRTAITTD
jgi:hypothetical protein